MKSGIIVPGAQTFFKWPLWFYTNAEPHTPFHHIQLLVFPIPDQPRIHALPVFSSEELAKTLGAENVPTDFKLQSLKQNGFIRLLKEVGIPAGVRYLLLDTRISLIGQFVDPISIGQFILDNQKPWWTPSARHRKTLLCVYCGKITTLGKEHEEHIIPESLGCKETLYDGAVCTKCNNDLGTSVDSKFFREPMAASGQVATGTLGKAGIREKIGVVEKAGEKGVSIVGGISGSPNDFFVSRAIAKCAINVFTHYYGSRTIRQELIELIDYVRQPRNKNDIWPFAAIYTPTGGLKHINYIIEKIRIKNREYPICVIGWSYCQM